MEPMKLLASERADSGKGAARRLRNGGQIPAVAYGKQMPTRTLAIAPDQIRAVLGREHGRNTVITLDLGDKQQLTVMLRDFQYHPLSRELLHADFVQIQLDKPVDVEVPLELIGKAAGVVQGGTLRQVFRKLPIRCLPTQIPVKLTHDVTTLELDGHVHVSDLTLPEGITVRYPAEQTVAAVVTEIVHIEEEATPGAAPAGASTAPKAEAGAAAAAPAATPEKKTPEKKTPEKKTPEKK